MENTRMSFMLSDFGCLWQLLEYAVVCSGRRSCLAPTTNAHGIYICQVFGYSSCHSAPELRMASGLLLVRAHGR